MVVSLTWDRTGWTGPDEIRKAATIGQGLPPGSSEPGKRFSREADAQSRSDADQTAADTDQTAVEDDRLQSDRDQAASDRDQVASDRDQAASDRDQDERVARGDLSTATAHEVSLAERNAGTVERFVAGLERTQTTAQRAAAAAARDAIARARDAAALAADREAEALAEAAGPGSPEARLAAVRQRAAADRARAAADRERAARDREAAAHDRERAELELQQAYVDELTGSYLRTPGRLALQREIDRAFRGNGRLVLAFLDVNDLKGVNDREGHGGGDRVLQSMVIALRSGLRSFDPIVRYGGDEFVCALSGADEEEAARRFDEIHQLVLEVHEAGYSVGLAMLERGDTLDDLIDRADAALYRAKRA
jgi:diguanylate cyclase (GGDEF)-like protein